MRYMDIGVKWGNTYSSCQVHPEMIAQAPPPLPSFCAKDGGTARNADWLSFGSWAKFQLTAYSQRAEGTGYVKAVLCPTAGLMINTLLVTPCFSDVRRTTGWCKQLTGWAYPPKLPPPIVPPLTRHPRYKRTSPSHQMIQLNQEGGTVLSSPENCPCISWWGHTEDSSLWTNYQR